MADPQLMPIAVKKAQVRLGLGLLLRRFEPSRSANTATATLLGRHRNALPTTVVSPIAARQRAFHASFPRVLIACSMCSTALRVAVRPRLQQKAFLRRLAIANSETCLIPVKLGSKYRFLRLVRRLKDFELHRSRSRYLSFF